MQAHDRYHINDFTWIAQYITNVVTSVITTNVLITLRYIVTYINTKDCVTIKLTIILLSHQLWMGRNSVVSLALIDYSYGVNYKGRLMADW